MANLVFCTKSQTIANQCPITGGQGVYVARSLYETIEPTIYDDESVCQAIGISAKTDMQNTTNSTSFAIVPNPTNGVVTLSLSNITEQNAVAVVYDALGQQVAQITIARGITEVTANLQYLSTGIYFVQLQQEGAIPQTQKLTLIH